MYIRITRGRLDPAKYDQLVSTAKDIEAAVRAAPGCQSYLGGGGQSRRHYRRYLDVGH
jgi:hypothetical protein